MPPSGGLTPARAAALGLLHGPAELLPVSSSAHVGLVATLAGWDWASLPGDVRKAFEVALHAGTLAGAARALGRPRPWFAVLSVAPAAVAGWALEERIERRLGGLGATTAGLVAGSALLVLADRAPEATRGTFDARPGDAVAVGAAQALALVPGLSRSGMAYAAARRRGFAPEAAGALAREAAVPVLAGATALKAFRLARRGLPAPLRAPFAAGALAAALSARAASPLARRRPPVLAAAAERCLLAGAALARARRRSADPRGPRV